MGNMSLREEKSWTAYASRLHLEFKGSVCVFLLSNPKRSWPSVSCRFPNILGEGNHVIFIRNIFCRAAGFASLYSDSREKTKVSAHFYQMPRCHGYHSSAQTSGSLQDRSFLTCVFAYRELSQNNSCNSLVAHGQTTRMLLQAAVNLYIKTQNEITFGDVLRTFTTACPVLWSRCFQSADW